MAQSIWRFRICLACFKPDLLSLLYNFLGSILHKPEATISGIPENLGRERKGPNVRLRKTRFLEFAVNNLSTGIY